MLLRLFGSFADRSRVFDRERAVDERGVLLRFDVLKLEPFHETEGLSSEMTRAFENPHIRLDVVLVGALHCARPRYNGCADVLQPE